MSSKVTVPFPIHLWLAGMCLLLPWTEAAEPVDCSKLPTPISPHDCCRFPEMFKQNAMDLCKDKRQNSEQCFFNCVFEVTEIYRKDVFSYNKVRDYVDWVMRPEDIFSPIYKNAYRKCIDKAKEMESTQVKDQNGCSSLPEMVYYCVQNEMFASCPGDHWKSDVEECREKRDFIHKCIRD